MDVSINEIVESPHIATRLKILHCVNEPLEKMSVKQICANAGISRDTFYRYFTSKYDILFWHGSFIHSLYLDQIGRSIDWATGYLHNYELLAQERDFYHCALQGMGYMAEDFPQMNRRRESTIEETLSAYHGMKVNDDIRFCIKNFVSLETLLTERWLRDGCKNPETFALRMASLVPTLLARGMDLATCINRVSPNLTTIERAGTAGI